MNGATIATNSYQGNLAVTSGSACAGDFNTDGKADIVWTNTSTGDRTVWFMSGTSVQVPAFVAKTQEIFTYDDDGNLTRDGRWVYQYDAENRLVAMFTRGAPVDDPFAGNSDNVAVWNSGVARQKLMFTYDYLGRRVAKQVFSYGVSSWVPGDSLRFVWNGWSLIAMLDANNGNALQASYYWGLDLSGTGQGAGGVGGLLLTQEGGNSYLSMFDGMGNVHGMIKASDGSIAAAYEYDAFGNILRESGSYAASNPFQYSTKYTDVETGLVYYGHRFYSPSLGRFINKDPAEEAGGVNLYGFCGNNVINGYDLLGLAVNAASPGDLNPALRNSADATVQARFAWLDSVLQTSVGNWYSMGGGAASQRSLFGLDNGPIDDGGMDMVLMMQHLNDFSRHVALNDALGRATRAGVDGDGNVRLQSTEEDAAIIQAAAMQYESDTGNAGLVGVGSISPNGFMQIAYRDGSTHLVAPNSTPGSTAGLIVSTDKTFGLGSPADTTTAVFGGRATVYNAKPGALTASGQPFDPTAFTAAAPKDLVPILGTTVTVEYYQEGQPIAVIEVVVNDRGPYAVDSQGHAIYPLRPNPTNVIDLTPAAMQALTGKTYNNVQVQVSIPSPTNQTLYYPRVNGQPQSQPPGN
jgi:RHS repeat-associated protein